MAKLLVDAPASGAGKETHAGSTPALDTKLCRNCGDPKALDQFYARRKKGKVSRRSECIARAAKSNKKFYATARNERNRDERKTNPAKYILFDARGSDRKHGRVLVLTLGEMAVP
jgi:hypothetical protein